MCAPITLRTRSIADRLEAAIQRNRTQLRFFADKDDSSSRYHEGDLGEKKICTSREGGGRGTKLVRLAGMLQRCISALRSDEGARCRRCCTPPTDRAQSQQRCGTPRPLFNPPRPTVSPPPRLNVVHFSFLGVGKGRR